MAKSIKKIVVESNVRGMVNENILEPEDKEILKRIKADVAKRQIKKEKVKQINSSKVNYLSLMSVARRAVRLRYFGMLEAAVIVPELIETQKLAAQIRLEVEPQLEQEREAYDRLHSRDKKNNLQGFIFDLKKYADRVFNVRPGQDEDLASANDTNAAFLVAGANKAYAEEQQAANDKWQAES
jgi:hypothetical protein